MKKLTALAALRNHFNSKDDPNKRPLQVFAAEVKALSDSEKNHLATLAAIEQGHDASTVAFEWTPVEG